MHRYTFAHNVEPGTGWAVVEVTATGAVWDVIMTELNTPGLTEAKAKAIAMILNAEDPH